MGKRSIRWKKPEWKNWAYLVVEESEIENWIAKLEAEGYIVEK